MLSSIFKVIFKILLALGVVFGALVLLQRFSDRRTNYIEIYNEGEDEDFGLDEELY